VTASGAIVRRRGSRPAPTLAGGEPSDTALDPAVSVIPVLALLGL
jgi:hypothetical protein